MDESRACGCQVIYRAARRGPNGKVYVAALYGLKAWPIHLPCQEHRRQT